MDNGSDNDGAVEILCGFCIDLDPGVEKSTSSFNFGDCLWPLRAFTKDAVGGISSRHHANFSSASL